MNPLNRKTLTRRQQHYRSVFATSEGQAVLRDLARFCRAHESTFHPDERTHACMEGRREVWLRIQSHIQMNEEDLWLLWGGTRVEP